MRDINDYGENYLKDNFEKYQVIYRRKKIMEVLEQYDTSSILEIGCGMEPLFKYLDDRFKYYTLIEPNEKFCNNAEKLGKGDNRINIYNGFMEDFFNKYNTEFSCIICSGLLHEVESPDKLLKSIADVCNTNTVVHINVPNANSFHRILAKEMELISDIHDFSENNILYQHNTVFDIGLLKKKILDSGFYIIESGSYFLKPFTHSQMFKMIQNKIINEKILDALYKIIKYFPEYGSEIYVNCKKG